MRPMLFSLLNPGLGKERHQADGVFRSEAMHLATNRLQKLGHVRLPIMHLAGTYANCL